MSLLSRLGLGAVNAALSLYGTPPSVASLMHWERSGVSSHRDWLKLLRGFYQQYALYDARGYALYQEGIQTEALKNLRTCAYRAVEFYVATVWPGTLPDALPVEDAKRQAVIDAIHQVWQWSDWERQKQVMVRHAATLGDSFTKVVVRPDNSRVHFQLIDPAHVADFDVDERGFLTWIRIDIPQSERTTDGTVRTFTHTEVWERETTYEPVEENGAIRVVGRTGGRFRRWKHTKGDDDIDKLGAPEEERPLSDFGIDFIPIDHCLFKDVGELWGMGCFAHTIEKQIEADRAVTRLHQMLYRNNKNTWILEAPDAIASDGRPSSVPPPRIAGLSGSSSADGVVDVGGESMGRVTAGWTIKSLVPQLQYDAALSILNAHQAELTHDLPELLYYSASELGANASGRARRIHLTPAIDRALEARANLEASLIRLNQMALTLGRNAGLFPESIGTYENGDFAHRFKERDVLPADELEEAQAHKALHEGRLVEHEWLAVATALELERAGYSADEIRQIEEAREATAQDAADRLLTAMERGPAAAPDDTDDPSGGDAA